MNSTAALKSQNENFDLEVAVEGGDQLRLQLVVENDVIRESRLQGIGCPEILRLLSEWRGKFTGDLQAIELPQGVGHAAMLLRELILKSQGRWQYPYQDEELCHCRAVPTAKVDRAILNGCHTVSSISRQTSAGTSCGTCRPDIEAVLNYRLGK